MQVRARRNDTRTPFERLALTQAHRYMPSKSYDRERAEEFADSVYFQWLEDARFLPYPDGSGRTWAEVNYLTDERDRSFQAELKQTFHLFGPQSLFEKTANEMGLRHHGEGLVSTEGYERLSSVEAAMKRMELVEPLAFEVYALHHGYTDPIPGHPFDRVIERGPGWRVTTGRRGRKAYERHGYTVPTLSRITKIEKRQLTALIEGIKPLLAADQALFESWTEKEVARFLDDDPEAIRAARARLPEGWAS